MKDKKDDSLNLRKNRRKLMPLREKRNASVTGHAGLDVADAVDQTARSLGDGLASPIPPIPAQQKRKRIVGDEQVKESTTSGHKKRHEEATVVGDVIDDDNTSGNDLGENQVLFFSNRNFVGGLQAPETARSNMSIAAEASFPLAADESIATSSGAFAISSERRMDLLQQLIVLLNKNMTWDNIQHSSLKDKYTEDEILFYSGLKVKELREELRLLSSQKSPPSAGTNYVAVVSVFIMMDLCR